MEEIMSRNGCQGSVQLRHTVRTESGGSAASKSFFKLTLNLDEITSRSKFTPVHVDYCSRKYPENSFINFRHSLTIFSKEFQIIKREKMLLQKFDVKIIKFSDLCL